MYLWKILHIVIVLLIYWLLTPFQKALGPTNHYEVHNSIFSWNKVNVIRSAICRFIIVLIVFLISKFIFNFDNLEIIFYIGLAQFCVEIPNIVNYKLVYIHYGILKILPLIQAILSVSISVLFANFFLNIHNLFCIIYILVSFCFILIGYKITNYLYAKHPIYNQESAFLNKYITYKNLDYEKKHLKKSIRLNIQKYANRYNLSYEFLEAIILLEKINRYSYSLNIVEFIVCLFFPKVAQDSNLTVGFAQVKFNESESKITKKKHIVKLLSNKQNIKSCASILRNIIDSFFKEFQDGYYLDDDNKKSVGADLEIKALDNTEKLINFVVSKYLTGFKVTRIKAAAVYTDILKECSITSCLTDEQRNQLQHIDNDKNYIN